MRTASWIIVNNATGAAVFETFNEKTAKAINTQLYEALPVLVYLQRLNASIKAEQQRDAA